MATVVVDTPLDHDRAALLVSDLVGAGRIAVDHLVGRGCHRPVMLTDDQLDTASDPRQQGFLSACREAGIGDPTVITVPATTHGGRHGTALALDVAPDLDAIFAYNDVMAIGAMQTLTDRDIRIPDDVAVVGCDDIALNTMVTPTLSSVRIDRKRIGQEAVRLLSALVDGRRFDEPTVVPVELVSRQSA
ncbi:MAG: substrate-binding domain-containing protein [Actinomycetota bacterium]